MISIYGLLVETETELFRLFYTPMELNKSIHY